MAMSDVFKNLSQRLPTAMNDPMLQLGLQLMAAGGPQQQNMSAGQRLAAAGQGFMQNQAAQQQMQHAAQLQQLRAMQMEQAQAEARSAEELRQRMADPQYLATLPEHSRRLAEAGASPEQVWRVFEMESRLEAQNRQMQAMQQYRNQQLGIQQQRADAYIGRQNQLAAGGGTGPAVHGPKVPTPRQTVDQPLPGNMVQRMMFNPQTGQYEPFGAPFKRGVQGSDILGALGIKQEAEQQPAQNSDAGKAPWSDLPTGSGRAGQPQMVPTDVEFNDNGIPVPTGHRPVQPPAPPIAAGGGGQARVQEARSPQVAQPRTKAEYDALPPGTRYLDPKTGKVATKR